ncbi:MobC family plasmid mobilization relaxosome protein [Gaoshiqia sediminis]|uniref:MobC family plasmid mobilization relaxosome protein n=1 Tax=Gaoshiqia sediminis TaxID=2986998 RepID=A0AA42CAI8_9BACT|nr:MobC family plasmid mobilization relaxosome protein [Gaoshiqia sediminis]MCW0483827.1 MobC family plasmid mobilization relaxosome protein [Gaoshiqia sediminis]
MKNKNGRPVKRLGEKMAYHINVKMGTIDYYTLKAKAREADVGFSECIRQLIRRGYVKQRLSPELHGHIRKLSGMANNLNQVARKANAAGYSDTRLEYLYLAGKIDNLLNQIRHDG